MLRHFDAVSSFSLRRVAIADMLRHYLPLIRCRHCWLRHIITLAALMLF